MGAPSSVVQQKQTQTPKKKNQKKLKKQQQPQKHQVQSESIPRLENTTICVPIVYGSIAFPLSKVDAANNTHKWTLYVRGPNNEDLSAGIAKVVFQLHPSFAQPIRELTAPPFEVTEKGWGEFEATIRIVWRDAGEKAMVLTHFIKLYHSLPVDGGADSNNAANSNAGNNSSGATSASSDAKKENDPVISEFYDEVVFTDPTETFHKQLMRGSGVNKRVIPKVTSQEQDVQNYFTPHSDEEDFKCLLEAQKFLEAEIQSVKDRILRADGSIAELDKAQMAVNNKSKLVASQDQHTTGATSSTSSGSGTKRKSSKSSGGASKKTKA
jgi:YEATS domain-containing protein 4